jgi:hypothetical protein
MSDEMTVKQYVAEKLMDYSGFGDKEKYPLEWDTENPYSQLYGYLEIADVSVGATIDALQSIGLLLKDEYDDVADIDPNPNPNPNPALDPQYYVEEEHPINRQATIYLSLKQKPGKPLTLKDLRDFLNEIDALELPETTNLEGDIHLMYDLGLSGVEISNYFDDDKDGKVLLLHPREQDTSTNPFNPNHPSVFFKDPDFMTKKTREALLKKYAYLIEQGEEAEAIRISDQIRELSGDSRF